MENAQNEPVDRYVTFMNIDCYKHASDVIDSILEVTKEEKNSNRYWEVLNKTFLRAILIKTPMKKYSIMCVRPFFTLKNYSKMRPYKRS